MRYFFLLTLLVTSFSFAGINFNLVSKDGDVNEASWPDHYLLIAVGFTGCPDICPTTLLDIRDALGYLDEHKPDQVKKLQPLFITIDPNRDSLDDISVYTAYFDQRIIGLRPKDKASLDHVVSSLRATYGYQKDGKAIEDTKGLDHYDVYHSTYLYLYSPKGELLDVYAYNLGGKELGIRLEKSIQ